MQLIRKILNRPSAVGLAIYAVVIVGVIIVGAIALRASFAKIQFARVFPLGYVPQQAGNHDVVKTASYLAIYGDSRAYLWDASTLKVDGQVANYAHGGITSGQLLLQLKTQALPRSNWALVQIGINDLHPLGVLQDHREQILTALEQNLIEGVELLLLKSDKVVISTIVPPGTVPLMRRPLWDSRTVQYVERLNTVIRQIPASHQNVYVLDASRLLGSDHGYLPDEFVDADFFLHINTKAYSLLNRELMSLMTRKTSG